MTQYKKRIYSGICICGHSLEDHHLGMVMNMDFYNQTGEEVSPGECEFYGSNEYGVLDENGNDHCHFYKDKDDPFLEDK